METATLQEYFLQQMQINSISATFYLVNGYQFKGVVQAFDRYVVAVECDGAQELLYKHAISTIIPQQHIDISAWNN